MLKKILFERCGNDKLDDWMIYGHYKMFKENELMEIIREKNDHSNNKLKIKKTVLLIENCILTKEIQNEDYIKEIKEILSHPMFNQFCDPNVL